MNEDNITNIGSDLFNPNTNKNIAKIIRSFVYLVCKNNWVSRD